MDDENLIKFQKSFTHPAIQNEIKNFNNENINLDHQGINQATIKIHSIFEKVCKTSLKKRRIRF